MLSEETALYVAAVELQTRKQLQNTPLVALYKKVPTTPQNTPNCVVQTDPFSCLWPHTENVGLTRNKVELREKRKERLPKKLQIRKKEVKGGRFICHVTVRNVLVSNYS